MGEESCDLQFLIFLSSECCDNLIECFVSWNTYFDIVSVEHYAICGGWQSANIHLKFCTCLRLLKYKMSWLLHKNLEIEVSFLGALAKLLKATINIVISDHLSVRPSVWNISDPNGVIFIISIFRKSVEKIQFLLKSDKNDGYFTRRPIYVFDFD